MVKHLGTQIEKVNQRNKSKKVNKFRNKKMKSYKNRHLSSIFFDCVSVILTEPKRREEQEIKSIRKITKIMFTYFDLKIDKSPYTTMLDFVSLYFRNKNILSKDSVFFAPSLYIVLGELKKYFQRKFKFTPLLF